MTKVSVMYPNSQDVKLDMVYSKNKHIELLPQALVKQQLQRIRTVSRNCRSYSLKFWVIHQNYELTL